MLHFAARKPGLLTIYLPDKVLPTKQLLLLFANWAQFFQRIFKAPEGHASCDRIHALQCLRHRHMLHANRHNKEIAFPHLHIPLFTFVPKTHGKAALDHKERFFTVPMMAPLKRAMNFRQLNILIIHTPCDMWRPGFLNAVEG